MKTKIKTNGGSMGDLGIVILVIFAVFLLWLYVGGGKVTEDKPFLQAQDGQTIPQ